MELDTSFNALTKAGLARDYFLLDKAPRLVTNTTKFSLTNAWCLGELSRLVYRQEADEIGEDFDGLTRQAVLEAVGMSEIRILKNEQASTFAMLVSATTMDDQPCTVLVFRGSNELQDWKNNLMLYQTKAFDGGMVHAGFMRALRVIWKDILLALKGVHGPLFITGHSMGAALGVLTTAQLVKKGVPVTACYTFGSPRVGDKTFTELLNGTPVFRIENASDIVTTVPIDAPRLTYSEAGECYYFDHEGYMQAQCTAEKILQDRKQIDWSFPDLKNVTDWGQKIKSLPDNLPSVLTDHAPINYVARLHQLIEQAGKK